MQNLKLIVTERNLSEKIDDKQIISINGGEILINNLISLENNFELLKESFNDFYKTVKLAQKRKP